MAATEHELDTWMAALARGDRDAFTPLFRELHPRALRFASRRLPEAYVDEVAQQVLVAIFARASEFTPDRAVLPWFYAVCANEVRRTQRALRGTEEVPESIPASESLADARIEQQELHVALERAIATLDARSAQAIGFLLGRADKPEIPDVTIRKRISRAYARLRAVFDGDES